MPPPRTRAALSEFIERWNAIDPEVIETLVRELREESDRAAVVIGAAHLDAFLMNVLVAFFLPGAKDPEKDELFGSGPTAPLSSFAARTDVARRLGLINDEFAHGLRIIRKIRNEFAH